MLDEDIDDIFKSTGFDHIGDFDIPLLSAYDLHYILVKDNSPARNHYPIPGNVGGLIVDYFQFEKPCYKVPKRKVLQMDKPTFLLSHKAGSRTYNGSLWELVKSKMPSTTLVPPLQYCVFIARYLGG